MLSLMYVSQARAGLTIDEIETIADEAAARNQEHNVTGFLVFNSRGFMQLLEGESDNVLSIMRKIETDDRHSGITYIRQDERERRECPDWSMRAIYLPMAETGAANVFTGTLPEAMELDTKILLTSFASQMTESEAEKHAKREEAPRAGMVNAANE